MSEQRRASQARATIAFLALAAGVGIGTAIGAAIDAGPAATGAGVGLGGGLGLVAGLLLARGHTTRAEDTEGGTT